MEPPAQVLVLYTGGTIGMREGDRGYVPIPGFLHQQLMGLPQFHEPGHPPLTTPPTRFGRRIRIDVKEYAPILDSSNMGIADWVQIARDIEAAYDRYDGFVVLHGTDTMAYTASALSFMLGNLARPVILTGSQIPLARLRNDAVDNLLDALTLAGLFDLPEVGVFFHHKLLRGNRSRKVSAAHFDAFRSGNYPPLAEVGIDIEIHRQRVLPRPTGPLRVRLLTNHNVAALRLYPGLTEPLLKSFLDAPLEGLVLETYGSGNAPERKELLQALRGASDSGVVIVNVTQCVRGRVRLSYSGGHALMDAGVVPGADMTAEAALTKLSWLLSQDLSKDRIRGLMAENLRGELTTEDPFAPPGAFDVP
ncbi:MAG: asparaginase [Myxococcota bacterium]